MHRKSHPHLKRPKISGNFATLIGLLPMFSAESAISRPFDSLQAHYACASRNSRRFASTIFTNAKAANR